MTTDNTNNNVVSIGRQDVQHSLNAYADLLKSTSKYYRKYLELSQCASEFAQALDLMSKCKGAEQSGVGLKAAAELHQTIAKQQEQLAECLHKDFELPLQRNLLTHQKRVDENEKNFDRSMKKMQDEISKTEGKMLKGRKKDLSAFQQSLQDMQRQAQELENIKNENLERMLSDEQKNLMFLVQKAAGVVKNEFDHYSSLSTLSREATEEIISIAFAPAGKQLDAAEKRRVVDKFLGSSSALSASVSGHRDSVMSDSSQSNAPAQKPPVPPSSATSAAVAALSVRPITPPTTPQPQSQSPPASTTTASIATVPAPIVAPTTSTSSLARSNSTTTAPTSIQDSIRRLNIAAAQVQQQQPASASTETVQVVENSASRTGSIASASVSAESGKEDQNTLSSALAAIHQQRTSMSVSKAPQPQSAAAPEVSLDLVMAIHDFTARTDRELSFKKNDVMFVKQRQENWLYATHYPVQTPAKSGWIPVSYTTKHSPSS